MGVFFRAIAACLFVLAAVALGFDWVDVKTGLTLIAAGLAAFAAAGAPWAAKV